MKRKPLIATTLFVLVVALAAIWHYANSHSTKINATSFGTVDGTGVVTIVNPKPNPKTLKLALIAYHNAIEQGVVVKNSLLTIIDYSLPSTVERLWVVDPQTNQVLVHTLVAHGKDSGANNANSFSNQPASNKSSIGLFLTENTYIGKHGYSLKIKGLEPGFNDNAEARNIVIHAAAYVNNNISTTTGRLGRSLGCPAVNPKVATPLINDIKGGSLVFAYYPEQDWLTKSRFL